MHRVRRAAALAGLCRLTNRCSSRAARCWADSASPVQWLLFVRVGVAGPQLSSTVRRSRCTALLQKIVIIIVWTVVVSVATPMFLALVAGVLLPSLPASASSPGAAIGLVICIVVASAAATLLTVFQGIKGRLPGTSPSRLHSGPAAAYKCPKCGYELRGVTGVYCPECGTVRPASSSDAEDPA